MSGINFGQNLGNVTELSGTVGAARTANRLGIPAIAISQGFASPINYGQAAFTARDVDRVVPLELRVAGPLKPQTVNFNVPSCPSGATRGLLVVPLGRTTDVGGYTLQSGTTGNGTFAPTVVTRTRSRPPNCLSTETGFDNDIDAFNNGYITATVLNQDLADR